MQTQFVRSLRNSEIGIFSTLLPVEILRKVIIVQFPLFFGGSFPVGRVIVVSDLANVTQSRLAHELVHVRQYSEVGLLKYWAIYLSDFVAGFRRLKNLRKAYRSIPFEYMARGEATHWANHHR